MPTLAAKIAYASCFQLLFLSLTWVAGINVNGFVPIIPGTGAGEILLDSSVAGHVVLGALSAAAGALILGLAVAYGSVRVISFSVAAVAAIAVAGASGIFFVLGGAASADLSLLMAASFITALFFTFLALASVDWRWGTRSATTEVKSALPTGIIALTLFYLVFVSGMYVNLFVAGPVFSLPVGKQAAALALAERSAAFVVHEALGALLLLSLVLLAATLLRQRRQAAVASVAAVLVGYSAYVGSLNLSSNAISEAPQATELISSVGLMAALVMTMVVVLKLRSDRML